MTKIEKMEKSLIDDGFIKRNCDPAPGCLAFTKGLFTAYWQIDNKKGTMPKYSEASDGTICYDGTFITHDYATFLAAIITCEFDHVEYHKQVA